MITSANVTMDSKKANLVNAFQIAPAVVDLKDNAFRQIRVSAHPVSILIRTQSSVKGNLVVK